jgi:SAM-dependent methyltransferase
VLHLGCTNNPYTEIAIDGGSLLHFEIEKTAAELYGFDFDEAGLAILRRHGSKNLYKADLEHLETLDLDMTFDVIVAGEMIEHLNNPGLFLDGIKRFMGPDTILLITTINAYCGLRFFHYSLTRNHGRNEPVHPDHVAYYSYSTLSLLAKRHGMEVTRFMFYDLGSEHRPGTRRILRMINDVCVWFAPRLADGVIAVCKLSAV